MRTTTTPAPNPAAIVAAIRHARMLSDAAAAIAATGPAPYGHLPTAYHCARLAARAAIRQLRSTD